MLWVIYTIWLVFVVALAILAERTENEIYGFILLLSVPFMFYVPFMV